VKELTQQWIAKMGMTTIPAVISEIITRCTTLDREPSLAEIAEIGERWIASCEIGSPQSQEIDALEAWNILDEQLRESPYSATRSISSAQKVRRQNRMISAELLV
jgi:hypothetical protein